MTTFRRRTKKNRIAMINTRVFLMERTQTQVEMATKIRATILYSWMNRMIRIIKGRSMIRTE
jgi:hypothetical protein